MVCLLGLILYVFDIQEMLSWFIGLDDREAVRRSDKLHVLEQPLDHLDHFQVPLVIDVPLYLVH